jgi:hypothetical protein
MTYQLLHVLSPLAQPPKTASPLPLPRTSCRCLIAPPHPPHGFTSLDLQALLIYSSALNDTEYDAARARLYRLRGARFAPPADAAAAGGAVGPGSEPLLQLTSYNDLAAYSGIIPEVSLYLTGHLENRYVAK